MGQIRIDVNGFKVRKNKDEGCNLPCIRLTQGDRIWYAKSVNILGPSQIVQTEFNPETPNVPFIWIETDSEVTWE